MKNKKDKKCKDCGKNVSTIKTQRCQRCYHIWAQKIGLRKDKKNGMYKHGKCNLKYYCKDCGKKIHFTTGIYGSHRCPQCHSSEMNRNRWKNIEFKNKMKIKISIKAKKRLSIPENNPNWKGGITFTKRPRQTTIYYNWRKKVFERDNYTCQKCGIKGGKLEAHHKKSWKNYPELRYIVNNGQTLCIKCHPKGRHGKKD